MELDISFQQRVLSLVTSRSNMTTKNETVFRQNLSAGNIAKSMTSDGNRRNSALLLANVKRRSPILRGLMNFQLQNFQLYNKSLEGCSLSLKNS